MCKFVSVVLLVAVAVAFAGCPPIERDAYTLVTGAKAALVDFRGRHSECAPFDALSGLSANVKLGPCILNNRLTSAKDAIVDAAEVYCSGKDFENGGACNPPAKGTPGYEQAAAKLKAAIASYHQIEKDAGGVLK
jgi:hypothetical protein